MKRDGFTSAPQRLKPQRG